MEYRRVGRGGAGNYYSPQDVEEATKRSKETDVEALVPSKSPPPQPSPNAATTPQYTSSGRGGAGNITTRTTGSAQTSTGPSAPSAGLNITSTSLEENTKHASRPLTHYGRGGAGNFRYEEPSPDDGENKTTDTDWERRDVEAIGGLQEPAKAHLGRERETPAD